MQFLAQFPVFQADEAGNGIIMTAQILGAGMHRDIRAQCKGILQIGRKEGIIHNQQRAHRCGKFCAQRNIRHIHHGVAGCFNINRTGIRCNRSAECLFIGGVHQYRHQTLLFLNQIEQQHRAAIEIGRANDPVTGGEEFKNRSNGCHTGSKCHCVCRTFQTGNRFFHLQSGGIGQAGIVKPLGTMPQIRMTKGGRLIDGRTQALKFILKFVFLTMDTACFDRMAHNHPSGFTFLS